ncbi:MAG: divalent-cation tolerance protein CutA [Methylomonas sp.]|jgi:periplasmic divalent cation tolerance protein
MHQLILCSCPDQTCAERIANALIQAKLAACVNILPGVVSVYSWQDQVETAQEHLLLIKSRIDLFAAIETAITAIHPYQIPEIIAVDIERGAADYLKWIDACTDFGA